MALQDILQRILSDAELEIKKLEESGILEKKKIQETFLEKELEQKNSWEEKTEKILTKMDKKTHSLARKEGMKMQLQQKNEIIETILQKILNTLENADEKTYSQILKKLFEKLDLRNGKILTPPRRMETTAKLAPKGFEIIANKDVKAGFIVLSGNIEIDNTFQNLINDEFHDELVQFIANKLK